jgi:hypothetical protein
MKDVPLAHLQGGASRGSLRPEAGLPAEAFAKAGGGHPQPDLFRPTIRVPLRGVQADAKRANAKT